ncbi:MAG TPA: lipoyl(octanoyl) transferase LipB [Terriglobales bacterium]|nr:lipoyl(octanoyl) transferase LipB [Terriglobales bacterium]
MISILHLGSLDYAPGLRLQQKLVELCKENRIGDVLLLLEHTPVITLGRNAKAANILASTDELARRGVEVFECDRGGDVTFHGPGQLVGYPIFDLRSFPSSDSKRKTLGVIEYVRRIEEALMRTCSDFGIPTQRICGLTGVWTSTNHVGTAALGCAAEQSSAKDADDSETEPAKIAAIGVHVSRSVTSHGFALNVDTDLSFFNLIIPCGIASKPVTSMAKVLGRPMDMAKVTNSLVRNFGDVFHSQILWIETLDALLGETVGVPLRVPAELREIHKEEESFWA